MLQCKSKTEPVNGLGFFEQLKMTPTDDLKIEESSSEEPSVNFETQQAIVKLAAQQPNDVRKSERLGHGKALVRNDFTPGAKIGDGAYGTVFKVQFQDRAVE